MNQETKKEINYNEQLEIFKSEVRKFMSENYPEVGSILTKKAEDVISQQTNLEIFVKRFKSDIEKFYRDNFENLKEEISEYLSEDYQIFKKLNEKYQDLEHMQKKYETYIKLNAEYLENFATNLKENEKKMSKINLTTSLYEEIFKLKEDISRLNQILIKFQDGIKVMLDLTPSLDLSTPINKLNFSTRTENALLNADVETVSDLIALKKIDLARLRNFGKHSMDELSKFLTKHNINYQNI